MNCIIVEDDLMCREALIHLISQVKYLNVVKVCDNPLEIGDCIEKENVELIFLDVEMPKMNGIEFLKTAKIRPQVILTTTHKEYALNAFEYNVIDYLVKPVKLPRFLQAVAKAKKNKENKKNEIELAGQDYFFIKKGSVLNKVYANEILWIEALGDYIVFNLMGKRKYILHSTLKAIENLLCPTKFARVHRSYIVQVDTIKEVENKQIHITDKPIPIGAIYRENFMKRLNSL
jgi:DNA-binding LytR/AlgR family response regulator